MIRKRNILILALLMFITFLCTTNYLLSVLNRHESEVRNTLTVEELIINELRKLPDHYKVRSLTIDNTTDIFINSITKEINVKELNLTNLWRETNSGVTKTQLFNVLNSNFGKILYALKNAKIISADIDTRGTQLKLLLTLEGNQIIVFKPKWYEKEKVIEGPVYAGKDRYHSEIIAFYLSIILKIPLTPITVEREISLKYDILPVATKRLLNTSFEHKNRTCIYGKCLYCKKEDPICDGVQDFPLKGAAIFNINVPLKNHRSPWQRTYQKAKTALWEDTKDYCKVVRSKLSKKRIYDLIDTALFDFLLQNGDRHHYETIGDTVVLLDNGKGLGNPNVHHIDILAPLYQCCILRRQTWKTLLDLTGGVLRQKLESIPNVNNFLTEAHMKAIEDRLLIIFATIEFCKNLKKSEHRL